MSATPRSMTGKERPPAAAEVVSRTASARPPAGLATGEDSLGAFSQYLSDLTAASVLPLAQEYVYARLALAGNRNAREKLIRHNLRFVVTLARKYAASGVPFEDLVQEGNMGLMKAVSRFDPDRGVRLVSYAAYWIERSMRSATMSHSRIIRLPTNRSADLSKIQRSTAVLRQKLNRAPSVEEIAAHSTLSVEVVAMLVRYGQDTTPEARRFDQPESTAMDRLQSESVTDEGLMSSSRTEAIQRLLSTLQLRDAQALSMWFGLAGYRTHTLEEIGGKLKISRERARQICDRAIKKLRTSPDVRILEDFWRQA